MNAVQYGLSKIHLTIPENILFLAFKDPNPNRDQLVSLDDKIMTNFIRPHVLQDMNVIGGISIKVDLSKCSLQWLYNNEYLITVPKSETNNLPIISAEEIVNAMLVPTMTSSYSIAESPIMGPLNSMYTNLGSSNVMQTARLEILGENKILVIDPSITPINGMLRCTIAHNANLENIPAKSYPAVAQLFVLGTKAYIYNKLKVELDQGFLYGGHELSIITEIVNEYADAYQQYTEYLTTVWRKVSYLSNTDNAGRLVKMMLSNNV